MHSLIWGVKLLAKGLSFCPSQNFDRFKVIKDLQLFARKFILQQIFGRNKKDNMQLNPQEIRARDDLVALLEESDPLDLIDDLDQVLSVCPAMMQTSIGWSVPQ